MTYLAHADRGDFVAPLSFERLFTAWSFEPIAVAAIVVLGGAYSIGLVVLARRGDDWPIARSVSFFMGGLSALVLATASSLATYDTVLLSMHMVQHMVLSMVAPIFLALGAPVTLALRTLPTRPRRVLLSILHSKMATIGAAPPVAFALFVISPWALYFSGWYEATLESGVLHELLHAHFVVVGCLFFWPLLGLDPLPGRVAYPLRMLTVFATLPFHAFLGVTIMTTQEVIARDWYYAFARGGSVDPVRDQYVAGGILWGAGDLIGLVIFAVLFVQWVQQSAREAAREDRRLDRAEAAAAAATPPPATGL